MAKFDLANAYRKIAIYPHELSLPWEQVAWAIFRGNGAPLWGQRRSSLSV